MKKWWHKRVFYQIYPRSFCDSNNDGIGDIPGIISKLDYLKELGIGAIWLSPVYASPNKDNGYDISDYKGINPEFGTMADMDRLFFEAEKRDIKIVMDLVINHTSDQHEWFVKSKDINSPYHDYYIYAPGRIDKKGRETPPNNWKSMFMGPAWQKCEENGLYYMTLFTPEQVDLNFRNPRVIEEVKDIMRFWLDKGAAGFRCDVINCIYKTTLADGKNSIYLTGKEHYISQPGCHRILKELHREILAPYDAFTVGETTNITLETSRDFLDEELTMIFPFDHTNVGYFKLPIWKKKYRPIEMIMALDRWLQHIDWNTLFFENHDLPRSISRWGDEGKYHYQSATMFATLLLTLRGTPFIYQGQEIGMINTNFQSLDEVDDVTSRNVYRTLREDYHIPKKLAFKWVMNFSRDHSRTPIPWDNSRNGGFSKKPPWLKVSEDYPRINIADNIEHPNSVLAYYRTLVNLRNQDEVLKHGSYQRIKTNKNIYAFKRQLGEKAYLIVCNMDKKPRKTRLDLNGQVLISNYGKNNYATQKRLQPYESAVIEIAK
ncbi:MAG: alpha-glucosidase [Bacilli bacterium]